MYCAEHKEANKSLCFDIRNWEQREAMFVTVLLKNSKQKVVIKREWVYGAFDEYTINNGLLKRSYIPRKKFYSPNQDEIADFNGKVLQNFNLQARGCFDAYICKCESE